MTPVEKLQWTEAVARDVRLRPVTLRIAVILLSHRNGQTGACFPSVATLANAAGVAPRTVQRALGELETAGFIRTRLLKKVLKKGGTSNYFFSSPTKG